LWSILSLRRGKGLSDSKIKGDGRLRRRNVKDGCNRPTVLFCRFSNCPRFYRSRHKVDQMASITPGTGKKETAKSKLY